MSKPGRNRTDSSRSPLRKKSKRSSADWKVWIGRGLAVCLAIGVTGIAYWFGSRLFEKVNDGIARANQPDSSPNLWPLPPETPEAQLYGPDIGSVVPCTQENVMYPLRPRATDPEFKLSNPRQGKSVFGTNALLLDVELVKSYGPIPPLRIIGHPQDQNFPLIGHLDWDEKGGTVQTAVLMGEAIREKTGLENSLKIKIYDPSKDTLEAWVEVSDSRYILRLPHVYTASGEQYAPAAASFKVTPSVFFVGTPLTPHPAREWHPDELKLFRTSGGEVKLFPPFDESKVHVIPQGWIEYCPEGAPFLLNVPNSIESSGTVSKALAGGETVSMTTYTGELDGFRVTIECMTNLVPLSDRTRDYFLKTPPAELLKPFGEAVPGTVYADSSRVLRGHTIRWISGTVGKRFQSFHFIVSADSHFLIRTDTADKPAVTWQENEIHQSLLFR